MFKIIALFLAMCFFVGTGYASTIDVNMNILRKEGNKYLMRVILPYTSCGNASVNKKGGKLFLRIPAKGGCEEQGRGKLFWVTPTRHMQKTKQLVINASKGMTIHGHSKRIFIIQ